MHPVLSFSSVCWCLTRVLCVVCMQTVVTGAVSTVADGAALVGKVSFSELSYTVAVTRCEHRAGSLPRSVSFSEALSALQQEGFLHA